MWFLRLLAVILVIAVGAGFLLYAVSGDRKYLGFSWRLARWGFGRSGRIVRREWS